MSTIGPLDLRVVIDTIGTAYAFVPEKYPALEGATSEQTRLFAVGHSLKHMAKTTGNIAAVLEAADHGATVRYDRLKVEAVKMTINALNLANALGMTAAELVEEINKTVK